MLAARNPHSPGRKYSGVDWSLDLSLDPAEFIVPEVSIFSVICGRTTGRRSIRACHRVFEDIIQYSRVSSELATFIKKNKLTNILLKNRDHRVIILPAERERQKAPVEKKYTRLHEQGHVFATSTPHSRVLRLLGPLRPYPELLRLVKVIWGEDIATTEEVFADLYAWLHLSWRERNELLQELKGYRSLIHEFAKMGYSDCARLMAYLLDKLGVEHA